MNTASMPKAGNRLVSFAFAAVLGILLSACGAEPQATAPSPVQSGSTIGGAITVLAAASLTEAFTQIGKDFEAKNPGSTVTFSFGSSATLATQIVQGAPADVFAAASPATMETVTAAGACGRADGLRFQHTRDSGTEGQSAQDHRTRGLRRREQADCSMRTPGALWRCGDQSLRRWRRSSRSPTPWSRT